MNEYKTLNAARADGWHKRKEDEVDGEEITLQGHTLVRNTTLLRYVYKTAVRPGSVIWLPKRSRSLEQKSATL